MNDTLLGFVPFLVVGFIAFIVLVVLIRRWLVNVGAREIAIKERRYIGAKMPPGRVVATEGAGGIGTLLLLSLFKERLGLDGTAPAGNGAPGNGSKVVAK